MRLVPVTRAQANSFITEHHRHHKPVTGFRFAIGLERDGQLVGIAVVGRPVARAVDQYRVAEVTRLCTDGSQNACSKLYGACTRAARAMGFDKIQTYILDTENGASLRASGWKFDGKTTWKQEGWHSRPGRRSDQPTCIKHRYALELPQ
jgi:hypothetical protein